MRSTNALSLEGLFSQILGGSWAVISRVISPLIWVITIMVTLLITSLRATHDPPGRAVKTHVRMQLDLMFRFLQSPMAPIESWSPV